MQAPPTGSYLRSHHQPGMQAQLWAISELSFGRRWSLVERLMQADLVVLPEPAIAHDRRLLGGRELLCIQNLVSERAVEPFVVSVLPVRSRIDPDMVQHRVEGRKPRA